MRIRIKKLNANARLPEYAHGPAEDAGLDIHCLENTVLVPGIAQAVATGLALEIPTGYEVQIRPRSGLAPSRFRMRRQLSIPGIAASCGSFC
jgi:dUTP pyrophosphatase